MRQKFNFNPLQYGWRPLYWAFITLVAGLVLSAWGVHATYQRIHKDASAQFSEYFDRIEASIQAQFNQPLYGLRGAIGAQASVDVMRSANFKAYVASRDLATEFPGTRGFGYIERVWRKDLSQFEKTQKTEQTPDYAVKTQGDAAELYVVKYIEPLAGNKVAQGLDMGGEAVRRETVERAINTGEPSLSAAATLLIEGHKAAGFLYMVPVYFDGTTPDTPQARRDQLTGLFYAPLVVSDLLFRSLFVVNGMVDFELFDGPPASSSSLVFSSQKTLDPDSFKAISADFPATRKFTKTRALPIGGRLLTLQAGNSALFDAQMDHTTPLLVGAGGAGLSLLLAVIVLLVVNGQARAEALAHSMTVDLDRLVKTQKTSNDKMTQSLRDLQTLMAAIDQHSLVSMADPAGNITYTNETFCRISGYSHEELQGQNHRIVNSGTHPPEFWTAMWKTISTGYTWREVVCNRAKDGSLYWVDTLVSPFFDDNGIEKYISIRHDITATRLAQQALDQEREHLSNIIAGTHAGTWEMNMQNGEAILNERWGEIIGYTLEELAPLNERSWSARCHPDDVGHARALMAQHLAGESSYYECIMRMRHRNGHWVWTQDRGKISARSPDGKPLWVSGTHMDISEQKNAEEEVRRTTTMLQSVLDAASEVAIITTGLDRTITLFNTGAERMLGYTAADVVGTHTTALFFDPDETRSRSAALSTELGRNVAGLGIAIDESTLGKKSEWTFIRKDGSRITVALVVTPLFDPSGARSGYLGISHDVSSEKDHENWLRAAMEEAEAATIAKGQFLANMSHEIRTPMNAILGMLKLLNNTDMSAKQRDYASKTEGAARSLLGLLNDILDFSKMDANKMALDLQPFRVSDLMRDLSVILSANVGNKPVDLLFDVDPTAPKTLLGDSMRLQQVLINLGGNALKFTEQGEVVIQIKMLAQQGGNATLRFSVHDSGIGISPENQAHIFDGFSQAEASTTRRFGGTGLGLSISKRLLTLMEANLLLDSTLGQGSTFHFTVTLPLADLIPEAPALPPVSAPAPVREQESPADPGTVSPAPPGRLQGMRLLVVEDNMINQQVADELLSNEGALIQIAGNGQLGVEAVVATHPPFDAVLMELQMPVMDGFAATHAIRHDLGLTSLPIIALTANAMASDRAACLAAGMNDHIGKPFDLPKLIALLLRHTQQPTAPADVVQCATALQQPSPPF